MPEIELREMNMFDIGDVLEIEDDLTSGSGWTDTGLLTYLMRNDTVFLIAEEDGEPVGYAGLLMVPFEGDILNIAVRKDKRRSGIATKLMEKLLHEASFNGVTDVHLEVRESNAAALGLYEKFGFAEDGIRKNYYTEPVENAITMTLRQG
jgi:[ribosomal protein S18]-alanine N-acetyltransferase